MPDKTAPTHSPELIVMSYHIAGSRNPVIVQRCGPTGDDKDLWMAIAGGNMIYTDGTQHVAIPWRGLPPQLQRHAGHTFEAAVKLARGAARAMRV